MDEEEELFDWASEVYSQPSNVLETPVTIHYSIDKDPATGNETIYPSKVQIEGINNGQTK